MKVVGLCKAFSGHEFVKAALDSVHNYLDEIVFVHADRSWTGNGEGNTVQPVVTEWMHDNVCAKVTQLMGSFKNQMDQYNYGLKYIQQRHPDAEWIFVFDTDEVWETPVFEMVLRRLPSLINFNAVCVPMKTYVKSPFYQVTPAEWCKPTVFVRPDFPEFPGVRGNDASPRILLDNAFFHHFTYVREYEHDVMKKIETSFCGDQIDNPECSSVEMETWIRDKWDKLPNAVDFHTTKGAEKSWHECKVVSLQELPSSVRKLPIIKQFQGKESQK